MKENIFKSYARYYDLLYKDKDYSGEAQFVHQLLKTYAPSAQSILDLGCGTGRHAMLLAKEGYMIHGVDSSEEMLKQCSAALQQLPRNLASRLSFSQGDIRKIRFPRRFDAITSIFHVICYQTNNDDLRATFETVKNHTKQGGIFIFDFWYGPAVLTIRPSVRIKRMEDEKVGITRIAEPVMCPNKNLVDVKYQIYVKDKNSGFIKEHQEHHRVRYLFKPEIDSLLTETHMKPLIYCEWMTNDQPGFETWSVCCVAQR